MNYRFVFDDGDNNLVNERGEPILDDVDMSDCLPLETLTNLDKYCEIERHRANMEVDKPLVSKKDKKSNEIKDEDEPVHLTRRYRIYSLQDREAFFSEWIEKPGASISSIARSVGISSRTAQRWVREFKESETEELPLPKLKGNQKPKLRDEHKD